MTTGAATPADDWHDEERDLRRREVRAGEAALIAQKLTARVQGAALVLALVASLAAAYAAYQAGQAVKNSEQDAAQQAEESQFTTAISAIGGTSSAQQVAGLTLLRRNVATDVSAAAGSPDALTRQNAYDAYVTSLDVFADYMRTAAPSAVGSVATQGSGSFGLGYGIPDVQQPPLNVTYAADELNLLLGMTAEVRDIDSGKSPAIDLSHDELYGLSWPEVNFGPLSLAYMVRIDLRSTNLTDSRWGHTSFLVGAYLQCADLSGADFRGANLTDADLRGANVNGANFQGAVLNGIKTDGAFGTAKGLQVVQPSPSWNQANCVSNTRYWDLPHSKT